MNFLIVTCDGNQVADDKILAEEQQSEKRLSDRRSGRKSRPQRRSSAKEHKTDDKAPQSLTAEFPSSTTLKNK